jgi:hypothetical protein
MGTTNSTGINGTPGSYAGVAGYYAGVASSATPPVAGGNALAKSGGTYNSIGAATAAPLAIGAGSSLAAPAGISAWGQSRNTGLPDNTGVNISAASGSGSGSSVIGTLTKADTSGITQANGTVYGAGIAAVPGGASAIPATVDVSANSIGTSYATLNPATALAAMTTGGYYSKADANGSSSSTVGLPAYLTTFGFGGR